MGFLLNTEVLIFSIYIYICQAIHVCRMFQIPAVIESFDLFSFFLNPFNYDA